MLFYKKMDACISLLLITACILVSLVEDRLFISSYFIVGGWQLLSIGIHYFAAGAYFRERQRTYYYYCLAGLVALNIILIPGWLIAGGVNLIISPVLAVWYCLICFSEVKTLRHKMFIHIKN